MHTLSEYLDRPRPDNGVRSNSDALTDDDVAALADWAGNKARTLPSSDWKRAYSLIREGADLLLRRRARHAAQPPYEVEVTPCSSKLEGVVTNGTFGTVEPQADVKGILNHWKQEVSDATDKG